MRLARFHAARCDPIRVHHRSPGALYARAKAPEIIELDLIRVKHRSVLKIAGEEYIPGVTGTDIELRFPLQELLGWSGVRQRKNEDGDRVGRSAAREVAALVDWARATGPCQAMDGSARTTILKSASCLGR